MTIPTIYRSDDTDAPVLRGERGSLIEVLRACLVDGYGEKTAAGWAMPFINADETICCFSNIAGNGMFIAIDEANSANAYQPRVHGWETMSSESDGLGAFSPSYQLTTQISNAAGTTNKPWVLIATDTFFYFSSWYAMSGLEVPTTVTGYNGGLMFGDIIKNNVDDYYNTLIFACIYGYPEMNAITAVGANGYSNAFMPRRSDGSTSTHAPTCVKRGAGPGPDSGRMGGVSGLTEYVDGGQLLYARPHLDDYAMYTLRGFLPGFYYPLHYLPFDNMAEVVVDSKTFLSIRTIGTTGYNQNILISLDSWG